jgi:single-stranded-DNA-specific exonuclease
MTDKKSLNGKLWKLKETDERKAELISQRYDLPFIVSRILASRDVPVDDVPNFIEPKLQNLIPNPYILKDLEKASKRIADAVVS